MLIRDSARGLFNEESLEGLIYTFIRHDKTLVISLLLVNKLYFIIILHNKDQLKLSHFLALHFIHHEMYIV